MSILLKLHYAMFGASNFFLSKVIEEKPLGGRFDSPFCKGRVKLCMKIQHNEYLTEPLRSGTHTVLPEK